MKTTRGKLYPTITLLKPYFKEEKLKDFLENEKDWKRKNNN
jgi:hypothetical protein